MNVGEKGRLIGLARDDAQQYVEWMRTALATAGAQIAHYAQNNAVALHKLGLISGQNAPLDFVTTDIVNVYSGNYREGIDFVRAIRALPADAAVSGGLRLKYIPIVVFTGGGFTYNNIVELYRIDSYIQVVQKFGSADRELARALVNVVTQYRHRVLAEFQRQGYAVFWEGGMFKLATAFETMPPHRSQYYAGNAAVGPNSAYSRLVLVTGAPSIARLAIEEFEHLLNARGTSESEIQHFFQRHPEFLLGEEYDSYWAEPRLVSPVTGSSLRPDFVLQPLALRSNAWRWNVVDLKRHDVNLLTSRRFHVDLSMHVYRAATQLRDYAEFFDDPRNAKMLESRFGGVVPKPKLTMVIGRLPERDRAAFASLQSRVSGVHIRTYDEILEFRRARQEQLDYFGT